MTFARSGVIGYRLMLFWLAFGWFCAAWNTPLSAQDPRLPKAFVALTVQLGPDRGQNPGSLFEIADPAGRVVAGAGFLGAYNTQPRSDRWTLHWFLKTPDKPPRWQVERLPAIDSRDTGFYPFSLDGRLYVHGRGGPDPRVWSWDASRRKWSVTDGVAAYTENIAGKHLSVTSQKVIYGGHTLLELPDAGQRIGEHYFSAGKLILRQYDANAKPPVDRLVVYPWQPETDQSLVAARELTYDIPNPIEFVYAFGQWRDHIVAVTNHGRVLRLDSQGWQVLREPKPGVSFQIYSAISSYDRLLLGHYPTGEIYEYRGEPLRLLAGWPPVMPGVARSAREAQSLTLYGGDLYAGVWPWAEVWRYDGNRQTWNFVQRMFSHPPATDRSQHPYEAETAAADKVANLWGQRVTGLEPLGHDLFITTSSKTGWSWEPRFGFLSPQERADYGAIYRATVPGTLSVPIRWTPDPTRLEFAIHDGVLAIRQDDRILGSVPLPGEAERVLKGGRFQRGQGIFGPFQGQALESASLLP